MLEVGELAPDFSVTTYDGKPLSLASFAPRLLVLYFFPKAFTPGCTKEARRFRDNYPEIRSLGAEVLGLSMDEVGVQCRFAEAERVTFPLATDSGGAIAKAFGVRRSVLPVARRVTFIVAPDRRVLARFVHEFQVSRHLDEVLVYLRANRGDRGVSAARDQA
jgi:peroxiredoxin Q/BCP